jgi:molybdopterin/thiamine biosynthesis adenylyltransferase
MTVFSGQNQINYLKTENWHPDRMQARGRYSQSIREARIALVGCGALGSIVAESLIRGGVSNLLIIDDDSLTAGNLVRHTLSGEDIGKLKAESLIKKLISIAPFSSISAYTKRFPTNKQEVQSLLEDRNIVIDCTADDEAIAALALGWWSIGKYFISAFVGYEAKRIYLFCHHGHSFPEMIFRKTLAPFIQSEKRIWSEKGEAFEGAGCWSPLFPARQDDLLLAASCCAKMLEEIIEKKIEETKLILFEEITDPDFRGLRRQEQTVNQEEGN